MKNVNYNLIKLLHSTLDIIWRIEKHYLKDAEEASCHSVAALESILANEKNHAAMLKSEIKMRLDAGVFD